jgi:hypothetical protein
MAKYQGFTPMGVLIGFLAIVLTSITSYALDLVNRKWGVLLGFFWIVVLIVAGALWRKMTAARKITGPDV